ncbi:alpha/beta fold hydrolase [Micromonospora profundi]|uniref:Alpha/beta hydrolase n=1 Tax=Micromonospora profundi TaxID=1420889 RepID=A0AAJ6L3V1_9ACTN|nr:MULTISPECIES: alpha/beta hydrolase [Micromonospora]KOX08308.1 hypothetical protein ADK66_16625 [Micromonospora sp. NRRL B-16802]NJC11798.1 pimeloyl-ACP methyl ester carboxylesterase [Micromonospora profundi]WLS43693.1 alpha/beta hydrolase [Micromonospora profundi]
MPHLHVNKTNLHFRESGSGPTALFLAGFILDSTFWLDQIADLSDIRRCVSLDLRGFGLSDPITTDDLLDLDVYVEDVAAVARELGNGQPVDLVGFSLSSVVGGLVAERYPELVRSMSFLSPNLPPDTPAYRLYRDEMAKLAVREGIDAVYRRFAEYIVASGASLQSLARYRQMMQDTRLDMVVATLRTCGRTPDRTDLPSRITVPTNFVTATGDTVFDRSVAQGYADKAPKGRVSEVSGAGRLTPLESPHELSAVLREFWNDL